MITTLTTLLLLTHLTTSIPTTRPEHATPFTLTSLDPAAGRVGIPDGEGFLFYGHYLCETTRGSPESSDVRGSAQKLKNLGTAYCEQKNIGGSHCTRMSVTGGAAIGICGKHTGWVRCWQAGQAGFVIAKYCGWNGGERGRALSGGTVWFDDHDDVRVVVY